MISDRDKLVELIKQADDRVLSVPYIGEDGAKALADYIIEDGWIKPPCNVGDKVYSIGIFTGQIIESVVTSIIYSDNNVFLHLENETAVDVLQQLGKTVFLTKDELKEVFKEKIIEQ